MKKINLFITNIFLSACQRIKVIYDLLKSPVTTRAQTESCAGEVNSWASLVNNSAWSGGLVLAIQILKEKSGISGFQWFSITSFQVLLALLAFFLALAAVMVAGERVTEGRSGISRFFVSAGFFVFFSLVSCGLVNTVYLVFLPQG